MSPMGLEFSTMEADPQNSNPRCVGQLRIPFQQQIGLKANNKGRDPKGKLIEEKKLELGFEKWVRLR